MIRDVKIWEAWEDEYRRGIPVDFRHNLRVMEGLRALAVTLGVWGRDDPMDGLEPILRVARTVNVRRRT